MKTVIELEHEVDELREEIEKLNEKVDSLTATSVNSIKKYTDKEIYDLKQETSISKTALKLGISKSTVQRACNRYLNTLLSDLED